MTKEPYGTSYIRGLGSKEDSHILTIDFLFMIYNSGHLKQCH